MQFNAPGDPEWIGIVNRNLFAEGAPARNPLTSDDQLVSVRTSAQREIVRRVVRTSVSPPDGERPALVIPEYAWLYCRATSNSTSAARKRSRCIRSRSADPSRRGVFRRPGVEFRRRRVDIFEADGRAGARAVPEILGPEYSQRGEELLLERARELEAADQRDAGLADRRDTHSPMSPPHASAWTGAAALQLPRRTPRTRLRVARSMASSARQRSVPARSQALILQSAKKTMPPRSPSCVRPFSFRAVGAAPTSHFSALGWCSRAICILPEPNQVPETAPQSALSDFLSECLASDSHHPQALWTLAARAGWKGHDRPGGAKAARCRTPASPTRAITTSPPCGHLAGNDFDAVLSACERAAKFGAPPPGAQRRDTTIQCRAGSGLSGGAGPDRHAPARRRCRRPHAAHQCRGQSDVPACAGALGQCAVRRRASRRSDSGLADLGCPIASAMGPIEPMTQTMFISALESQQRGEYEQARINFGSPAATAAATAGWARSFCWPCSRRASAPSTPRKPRRQRPTKTALTYQPFHDAPLAA